MPAAHPDAAALQPSARPNALGRFGPYGGQYVPETLMPALAAARACDLFLRMFM